MSGYRNEEEYRNLLGSYFDRPYNERRFFYVVNDNYNLIDNWIDSQKRSLREFLENNHIGKQTPNVLDRIFYEIWAVKSAINWILCDSNMILIKRADLPDVIKKNMEGQSAKENTLYIGHPCKKNVYIEFEKSEVTFLTERVNEFIKIMQSQGVKSCKMISQNEETKNENNTFDANVNANIPSDKGNFDVKCGANYSKITEELKKILSNASFENYEKGKITDFPKDCVWYEYEKTWKNLVEMRQNGKYKLVFTLTSEHNGSLTEREGYNLNANMKTLKESLGVGYDIKESSIITYNKVVSATYDVDFYND